MASKMALPIAGAIAMIGVSPAPAGGRSLRSSRMTSIWGVSRNRGHAIAGKSRVEDPPVLEVDGLEERTAESHDHRAFDLVLEMVGVDDGAALERADGADDLDAAGDAVDGDLGAGGDEAALFGPSGDADSVIGLALPAPAERRPRPPRARRGAASSLRFFRRNSSGSISAAWASSSMWTRGRSDSRWRPAPVGALPQGRCTWWNAAIWLGTS